MSNKSAFVKEAERGKHLINLCHCAQRSKALTHVFVQMAFQQTARTNRGLGQLEKERISQF